MALFQASKRPMPATTGQLEKSGRAGGRLRLAAARGLAGREENAGEQRDEQGERPRPPPEPDEELPVRLDVLEDPASPGPEAEKEEPERLVAPPHEPVLELPLGPETRGRMEADDRGHVAPRDRPPVLLGLRVHPSLQRLELGGGRGAPDDALGDPRHAHEQEDGEDEEPPVRGAVEQDEGDPERGVDGQDVAAVGEAVQPADREQDEEPPREAGAEVGSGASPLGALHLQGEAQAEQEREDAEPLAADEDPGQGLQNAVHRPVDVVGLPRGRHEAEVLLPEVGHGDARERQPAQRVDQADAVGHLAPRRVA